MFEDQFIHGTNVYTHASSIELILLSIFILSIGTDGAEQTF